jgi:uncharacterized protein (TIGR00661 family)
MRILYGVHGYGRGHATRTASVLPHLARHHQLLILAGGDAFPSLWPEFNVVRIPTLGFAYANGGSQRSNRQTFRRNVSGILDLKMGGPLFDMVRGVFEEFSPDVVISDAEAWTHHVARHLRIPRIGFDHIGMMVHCRPEVEWLDRIEAVVDSLCYRMLVGKPERVLVSSFYPVKPRSKHVRVVGTLPRPGLRNLTPTNGEHLVAYFNRGNVQLTRHLLDEFRQVRCPIRIYGCSRRGREGNLTFLPPSNLPFLEDLASCRAVLSTAGNQLMGEALQLGKPMLVVPERCVEQRLNAAAVQRLGVGKRLTWRTLNAKRIRQFLDKVDDYKKSPAFAARDGLVDSLESLHRFLGELVPHMPNPSLTDYPSAAPIAQSAPVAPEPALPAEAVPA